MDAETCGRAILTLLHGVPAEQRGHAFVFCLDEVERLYRSAGCTPPPWINLLRDSQPSVQPTRSRERMRTLGPGALSAPELLTIVLGTGAHGAGFTLDTACNVLREFSQSDAQALRRIRTAGVPVVAAVCGLGTARAAALVAGLELGRIAAEESRSEADKLNNPAAVFEYLHPSMRDLPHESFRVLLLDHQCRLRQELVVGPYRLSAEVGAVCLRDVFRAGVAGGAHGLVLVQNRPSGDTAPSMVDQQTTKEFQDGCRTLDLVPHDHIIIGDRRFYSAAEAGLLPGWKSGERMAADRQAP